MSRPSSFEFASHSAMLEIDAGPGAGTDSGPLFVRCLMQAADDAGLPADPGFRAGLRQCMERAVEEVVSYSPRGSEVAAGPPVPHRGWNGLE